MSLIAALYDLSVIFKKMVLSDYAKLQIFLFWREGLGPTAIVKALDRENIRTSRKSVHLLIQRYALLKC